MILPDEEKLVFFTNFYPLLHYAAVYSGIVPKNTSLHKFLDASIGLTAISRNVLFKDKDLLNDYMKDNVVFLKSKMPGFVQEVKKGVFSEFIVLKQEKQFGVFMDRKTGLFYHVTALSDPFDIILKFFPGYCETSLFNFKGWLVWDGLVVQKQRPLAEPLAQVLTEKYNNALKAKKVIERL